MLPFLFYWALESRICTLWIGTGSTSMLVNDVHPVIYFVCDPDVSSVNSPMKLPRPVFTWKFRSANSTLACLTLWGATTTNIFDDSGKYPQLGPSRSNCARMDAKYPIICKPLLFCSGKFTLALANQKEDSYPIAHHGKEDFLAVLLLAWKYDWLSYCSMIDQECMMLVVIKAEACSWRPFLSFHYV